MKTVAAQLGGTAARTELDSNPQGDDQPDSAAARVVLDVCRPCQAVWFDKGEARRVPRKPPPPPRPEDSWPQEQRERMAIAKIQADAAREREIIDTAGPEEAWQWLPGLLGLPVEIDAPQVERRPWVTWGVAAVCIMTSLLVLMDGSQATDAVVDNWGFVPSRWDRQGGATFVTAFFLHGGLFHLLGNMWFLIVFGDNVEDRLGHLRYAGLLAAGHVLGAIAHSTFGGSPDIPCVGASAGISAVIACYAVAYPRVQLAFLWRWFYYFRWLRFNASTALVLYVLLQILGTTLHKAGAGGVAYFAHLGGLAVGLAAGWYCRSMRVRASADAEPVSSEAEAGAIR